VSGSDTFDPDTAGSYTVEYIHTTSTGLVKKVTRVFVVEYPVFSQTFVYTGDIQTFTVPENVTSIKVHCWGAAGGNSGYPGGAGGYAEGKISVTPYETLYIAVGRGGQSLTSNGGGGGGMSGVLSVWNVNNIATTHAGSIIIAGAGGGGGDLVSAGGCGGGEIGGTTDSEQNPGNSTDSNAGPGAAESDTSAATNPTGGSYFRGGNSAGNYFETDSAWPNNAWGGSWSRAKGTGGSQGGGGGGGHYGASGAGHNAIYGNGRGAAGGSGYIGGDGTHAVTDGRNLISSQTTNSLTPPNTSSKYYIDGIGKSSASVYTSGGNGLVVIEYN